MPIKMRSEHQRKGEVPSQEACGCDAECDIFDFMAVQVGMTVIHPGGMKATCSLAEACGAGPGKRVIDIGCGKGTSSVLLAEKYGCQVTGIDTDERLLGEAQALAESRGVEDRVQFRKGDALKLPFSDRSFDVALSQAVLVLVRDQKKAALEALRVIRPGGSAGWLELSWNRQPPPGFLNLASNVLCAACMRKVRTFEDWENLFRNAGAQNMVIRRFPFRKTGFAGMRRDEGLAGSLKIAWKIMTKPVIRRRMNRLARFMREHRDIFGYGIYVGKKMK
jgi:ubiquinone/menaquinone biosynthesis C-methylase UbiE